MYRWRASESFSSELLKEDQSGHPNLWKAPNNDVHQIWLTRKPVSNYLLKKTVITFVHKNNSIPDRYVQKILLRIHNKSNYIYLWWKEKETA